MMKFPPKSLFGWILYYIGDSLLGSLFLVGLIVGFGSVIAAIGLSVYGGECPFGKGFSTVYPAVYGLKGIALQVATGTGLSLIIAMCSYMRRS